jgi:hypothetical protein
MTHNTSSATELDFATLFDDPTIAVIDLVYTYNAAPTGRGDDRTRASETTYTIRYARSAAPVSTGAVSTGFVRVGAERFAERFSVKDEAHLIRETQSKGHARLTSYVVLERFSN